MREVFYVSLEVLCSIALRPHSLVLGFCSTLCLGSDSNFGK